MGRYHPPESLDKSLAEKTRAGFNRTKDGKSTQAGGIPTIRFEMPFAVWCTNCKPETIIGQGVRFNAQKTKVGNYYSTPIWNFKMKHGQCGAFIDIRTDPQAGDYVVHAGARRRDYGDVGLDATQTLLGEVVTEQDRARRAADPFASLEGRVDQKEKAKRDGWWVEKIQEHKDRDWEDTWTANQRLRQTFRKDRKGLEAKDRNREELADRLGLHIDVLDEVPEDGQRAALMQYGGLESSMESTVALTTSKPLFAEVQAQVAKPSIDMKTKTQIKAEKSKTILQQQLKGNTRAIVDPFLHQATKPTNRTSLLVGIKRKRDSQRVDADVSQAQDALASAIVSPTLATKPALVEYQSSDDDH